LSFFPEVRGFKKIKALSRERPTPAILRYGSNLPLADGLEVFQPCGALSRREVLSAKFLCKELLP